MSKQTIGQSALTGAQKAQHIYKSLLIGLFPIYVMAGVYYGLRVLLLGILAAVFCQLLDVICLRMRRQKPEKGDWSAVVTGLGLTLLLPATVPVLVLLLGCFGAICVAKHPFGGAGSSPFVPSAVGFCLTAVCFPAKVLTYPMPLDHIPVLGSYGGKLTYSTVHLLSQGALPAQDSWDLLLGQAAGPLGQSSMLVIFCCFLFLLVRRAADWRVACTTLLTAAAFAALFPRSGLTPGMAVFYELACGTLLFATVFLASYPGSLPKGKVARVIYGFVLGITGMLFRYFGQLDLGFLFALIFCNALTPTFDVLADRLIHAARSTPKLLGHQKRYAGVPMPFGEDDDASMSSIPSPRKNRPVHKPAAHDWDEQPLDTTRPVPDATENTPAADPPDVVSLEDVKSIFRPSTDEEVPYDRS